jgi:hypothetical protein
MRRMRDFVARYPKHRSRCIKIRVALRRLIIALFCSTEPTGEFRSREPCQQIAKLDPHRRINSVRECTRIVSSIVYRPRQSRPCDGGQSDRGGGSIACDRNEEEECFALAAIAGFRAAARAIGGELVADRNCWARSLAMSLSDELPMKEHAPRVSMKTTSMAAANFDRALRRL